MPKIIVGEQETLDKAIRRFKKICNAEGGLALAKRCAYFEKPSDRKRREEKERLKSIRLGQKISAQTSAGKYP